MAAWPPERRVKELMMRTIMGWIDKIVTALARRKVDKREGRRR